MKSNNQFFYENHHFIQEYSVNVSWEDVPTHFPMHWHTVGEIVYAKKDHVRFHVQGKDYILNNGDLLFIWPGELHATLEAEPLSHLIIQYYNDLLDKFSDMSLLKNYVLSRHYISASDPDSPVDKIAAHMNYIKETFHSQFPMNNTRMCLSLYHILLEFYDFCYLKQTIADSHSDSLNLKTLQSITIACCYISDNCDQDLSLDNVASYVGISKFHFSRIFKEYTNISFNDFLIKQRIHKSITLFENINYSIAEIAFQSGFGSIASFNRCFKKEKNCTPSEYRALLLSP